VPRDFRLISLIHSFAKLLTKVLAIRLSRCIDQLVSQAQSAFIKRRCISTTSSMFKIWQEHIIERRLQCCYSSLISQELFDSVSWEYLLELLEHRGFPSHWCNWLSLLFTSSSSAVRLNGMPGKLIEHWRGLRQGGPLSRYLFILAIDTLQHVLQTDT
jgi:hypothetical protein